MSTTVPAAPPAPSAPRTARERVREEMTAEILAVAGAHVARDGAAALSLRSIARDLGMAPSALYRYFDGRDALLSALILSAYGALADEAEQAADEAERETDQEANDGWPCPAPCGTGPSSIPISGASSSARPFPATTPRRTRSSPTPAWRSPSCARCWRRTSKAVPSGGGATADYERIACRRGAGHRGAPAWHAGRDSGACAAGVHRHHRRHQPGGLRALAQHGARTRAAVRRHRDSSGESIGLL